MDREVAAVWAETLSELGKVMLAQSQKLRDAARKPRAESTTSEVADEGDHAEEHDGDAADKKGKGRKIRKRAAKDTFAPK